MSETVVTVLQRGKEKIAEGWCQHESKNERGEVCAAGALIEASLDTKMQYRATRALLAATACGKHHVFLSAHNDLCLDDQVGALDWFDRAIRMAKDQRSE